MIKRIFLFTLSLCFNISVLQASLQSGSEYYIWLNIYEKVLGDNADKSAPALSAFGTNVDADSYIFIAEDSGQSGYVLLRQKSSGKYLAASSSNAWSMTLEERSTNDRFCWSSDEGVYTYLKNKKNSKYMGVDGAAKGSDYVSVYYDKPKGSHSQLTIIPTAGKDYVEARQAYESAIYTNAQGVHEIDYVELANKNISRSDAIDIHLTANEDPISGSTIVDLCSDRTWLVFDNIVPSKVISTYLKYVRVNGSKAVDGSNCRVAVFLNGAVVLPIPSVIFAASGSKNFTLSVGNHSDLKENSNVMTGFTLRRGYMATLAVGRNGSGHSRVYVADHADIEITLPTALAKRVTSVNLKPWQYLSKKGWGNTGGTSGGPQLRATWYWSWSAGYNSTKDMEYVPCRQHLYWPSASEVNSHTATASLSLNEPEHSEQHTSDKCSCGGVISSWNAYKLSPDFQAGGGRIGSAQPTDFSYLTQFCKYVDENNNESRCDFVVTHAYWDLGGRDESSYASWFVNQCKNIWNNTKRPVWLTEMEISASWNSNKVTSYDQNRKFLLTLLQKIDECPWIERYAIYGTDMWQTYMFYEANPSKGLTPAGQVYRDHRATFAYNSSYIKEPVWWAPGLKKPGITAVYHQDSQTMDFNITNGNTDMTETLEIEQSPDGVSWSTVITLADRQLLEDSQFTLEDIAVTGGTDGMKFRVKVTTLTGNLVNSDAFELGSLVNGTIVATSKSSIQGWTCVRGAQNGYTKADTGDTYFEAWHPTADGMSLDYYQDLSGLKNGVYRLQANVFNSTNGDNSASINGAVGLYAQNAGTTWFAPVTEDSNMDDAEMLSLDKIVVTDGCLRVGVRNIKAMTARWAGADNFSITYLGSVEDVLGMTAEKACSQARRAFLKQLTPIGGGYDVSCFIHNPDATSSADGWTTSNVEQNSGEAYDKANSDPKNTYFDKWSANSYSSSLKQSISGLPAGEYVLSAMLRSNSTYTLTLLASTDGLQQKKVFTGNGAEDNASYPKGWQRVELAAISLEEGDDLNISLSGTGSSWWSADHFQLTYFPKDDPNLEPEPNNLAFSETEVQVSLGQVFVSPTLENPYDLPLSWTSSDETVATVSSTGEVTLLSSGITEITATFAGSDSYEAGSVSYTLTVTAPELLPNGLTFSQTEVQTTLGDPFIAPTLENPHNLVLSWSSSNETVAIVDSTGEVTLLASGITEITATFAGSDSYEAGSVSYTLTVTAPELLPNDLSFSQTEVQTMLGKPFIAPTLENPHDLALSWTSSDESVATVDSTGVVTPLAVGSAEITATFAGSDSYEAGSVSYTLTIAAPVLLPNDLSFSQTEAQTTLGEPFIAPTLENPHDLALSWTSSHESVATVDSTGTVTPLAEGFSEITATFAGSDMYEAGSVSYMLTVKSFDGVHAIMASTEVYVYTLSGTYLGSYTPSDGSVKVALGLCPGLYILRSVSDSRITSILFVR